MAIRGSGVGGRLVPGADDTDMQDASPTAMKKGKRRRGGRGRGSKNQPNGDAQIDGSVTAPGESDPDDNFQRAHDDDDQHNLLDSCNGKFKTDDLVSTLTLGPIPEEKSDAELMLGAGETSIPTLHDDTDAGDRVDEVSRRHDEVALWLDNQIAPQFRNISVKLKEKVVDFIVGRKYRDDHPEMEADVRRCIWRAVIRANYFYINPDTGLPTGRAKPIRIPEGVYAQNFEVFIMCAAERAERVGRDLPSPEHVKGVEDELRHFFNVTKAAGMEGRLEHLGFLLLIDEGQNRTLSAADMQERVRMAFETATNGGITWDEFEVFRGGPSPVVKQSNPALAHAIWEVIVALC